MVLLVACRRKVGVLLLAAAVAGCSNDPSESDPVRSDFSGCNVVLISIDTLRADGLKTYGADARLGKRLDRFAQQAVVFEHARSQAPQTAPSHMSLFTGVYPSVHGVQNVQHKKDPVTGRREPLIVSAPVDLPTLAEVLSSAGYATVALTDGGNLNPPHGFDRGFDEYTKALSGVEAQVADGLDRLSNLRKGDAPFFLFWHTYEAHAPYVSPDEFMDRWTSDAYDGQLREVIASLDGMQFNERFGAMKTRFWANKHDFGPAEAAYMRELYSAGIDYTDHEMGALLDALDTPEARADTIVVILSDHGEEFAEHGQWQHDQVYEECLRVPLMVRLPDDVGAGLRVKTPVALIDVMPTLLELLKLDRSRVEGSAEAPLQGLSLVPSLLTGAEPMNRAIYSEYRADRKGGPLYDWQIAVHYNGYKLIYNEHRSSREKGVETRHLFHLEGDPDERNDRSKADPLMLKRMTDLRDQYQSQLVMMQRLVAEGRNEDLTEEMLRQLDELGYLGNDSSEQPVSEKDRQAGDG